MTISILVPQVIVYFKVLGSVFALVTGIVFPCNFQTVMIVWKIGTSNSVFYLFFVLVVVLCALGIASTSTLLLPFFN